ncbi:UDP-N-acetylglucosamine 2-epimerase [Candidatus Woesearchaeota archaeon]|nr:UDP-N-acetylglucosamine 2-epimerase [Candidatus Woesearchaeota archaeon]
MSNQKTFPITGAYESMFGSKAEETENFLPKILPLNLNKRLINSVMEKAKKEKKWVLAFVIGTKPCFYKFYGSIAAANKLGMPNFVINSNQHYDDVLTHGLTEFNLKGNVACNLAIRGDLAQKSAELMIKVSWFARHLKKNWPTVTVVPVVLGDTIMTAIVPAAWMFSRIEKAAQFEAGLRSMAPEVMKRYKSVDIHTFIDQQFYGKWILLRNEPFPEQWDTYTSAAGSEYLFAPVNLNKEHLLREGYPESNIWVTGGVVVDALELKRKEKSEKSIFDIYPQLENEGWIRVDIHRRENLTPTRFRSIINCIESLVKKGNKINFIEMSATRSALDFYKLRESLNKLKKYKNFLHTNVWPEYANVVEFFESKNCLAALTDSGGVQEELNLIGKACLTCRLSTDRPETVFDAKSNVIVPPISGDYMVNLVSHIIKNEDLIKTMENGRKLYGNSAGKKNISILAGLMKKGDKPFKWAHEALGLWEEKSRGIEYL